jgi:hypothetical protein
VATVVGPYCCRKFCTCKDYINIPDGGIVAPAGCDKTNPLNTCPNIQR